ncbi:MAG: NADH-quinone oxidoreductase subunit H [Oscillospiraceae bacterium]|nr:NADH-quinone oxidoreductase subunit H [Oscillospiraceae bacterium]
MESLVYILVQLSVILLVAPLVNGVIGKVKALSQKRRGAPLFQMYFDLVKLVKKGSVVSETSSWIFKAAPCIFFSSAVAAALLVPVSTTVLPLELPGDAIMLISILALGRFFMMVAALDTGSSFGGMGSSREAMISSLIEPSILVSIFTIGLICKSSSIPKIMIAMMGYGVPLANSIFILTLLALLIIIIAETSRIPVDDPSTHLELTMVHEAMLLEYSGRHLALMEYGATVKQLVFITLLVNVLIPTDQLITIAGVGAVAISLLFYLIKVIFVSLLIAVIEVNTVKFRVFSIPNLAALAFILAFIGFLQCFVIGGIYV